MSKAEEMRAAEKVKIAELIQDLREVFHQKPLTQGALKMYIRMWWPYDSERLEEAIRRLPTDQTFMPSPGELKRYVMHKAPSRRAAQVIEWLNEKYPDRASDTMSWLQDELDEACEAQGFPKGLFRQGEL